MAVLNGIKQGKKKTFRKYIDKFTKMEMVVGDEEYNLKWWMFKKGMIIDCMFWEKLELEGAGNMIELLNKDRP